MSNVFSVDKYSTLVFDCDGVVLNSNAIKTNAFYQATIGYGKAAADAMVEYHITNGGVSRYKKFAYFIEQIAPKYINNLSLSFDALLHTYSHYVRDGLLTCEVAPGLESLRKLNAKANWLIVSGGDQSELREVFAKRGMADWFNGGIFGSPRTKEEILVSEMQKGLIDFPAIFFGDSKYDYEVANSVGLDFTFVSGWSEVNDWEKFVYANRIHHQPFI